MTGKDGHKELRDVFETREGDIYRTIAIDDGHPLTDEENQKERDRISKLAAHPDEIRKGQKQREEDGKNERELLKMFPQAFRYRYDRTDGKLIELKFTPNPDFPTSVEAAGAGLSPYGREDVDRFSRKTSGRN